MCIMCSIVLCHRRCKFYLLVASTALAINKNLSESTVSAESDILARCGSLQSDISVLTVPTDTELPSDVAATLSAHSGGFSSKNTSGEALVEVYTQCIDDAAMGVAMEDIWVSYDEFAGRGSQCEVANCGSYYQATNANCAANVTNAFHCAINGALKKLPSANNRPFWSSASSISTIPYPQAFHHSIALSDQIATLQVYSIHMRNNDACGLCDTTLDTIIPCLRLEDVTRAGWDGALRFCKPTINAARIKRFFGLGSAVKEMRQLSADVSSESGSKIDLIWRVGIGSSVLLVLMVLGICCFCCKNKMPDAEPTPENTAAKPAEEQNQTENATRTGAGYISRMIRRREANSSDSSVNNATNVNVPTHEGRRSSWFTFQYDRGNRESTVCGRRSSMAGTRVGAGVGGKTVSEYCNESEALTDFMQDAEILSKRISFDELTFLRVLSNGACGEVWLGQLETRHVAIKRLLPEKCQLTASLEQFAGELQLMCILQHRNIVSFIGVSWNRLQNLCAVVEYMDAGDLDEVLKKNREKFSWQREKISIAMDVAEGLVYLHCLRPVIVHRDLKSKNVLLNRKFHAKLSDFGVSRKTHVNETMTSGVGTLLWTAPEIIEGKKYSEKADIYSLGVVLSEMDTCKQPFSDVTSDTGKRLPGMQLAQLVRLGKIRVSLQADCPPALRKMIMDCTQVDPDARPSSMQVAFTLKSIIAPALRMPSATATAALTSSSPSASQAMTSQSPQQPSSSVKDNDE